MLNSILILTNDRSDADVLKKALGETPEVPFELEWIDSLSAALTWIAEDNIGVILLDLTLADSQGLPTFDAVFSAAKKIPIITMCGADENPLAIASIARGAQAILPRTNFCSVYLPQALRNIVQRSGIEISLNHEKWRADLALNAIADAVICTDNEGLVNYLNDAAVRLTGWERENAFGLALHHVFKIMDGTTRIFEQDRAQLVLRKNRSIGLPADTVLIRKDKSEVYIDDSASPIHDGDGLVTGVVIVFRDITQHRAQERKMAYLAQHDFLTDLPNRVLLDDRIAQAIAIAERNKKNIAMLFLDLDNFKYINDSLGHPIGDELLKSVAQRLVSSVRSSDTVSRQGGDEFIILLADGTNEEDAAVTAQKILNVLAGVHEIDSQQLYVTTSIGISIYPADGADAETLLKNADTAMYHAKEEGRNNFQFFRSAMNIRSVERQLIESHLRTSLEKNQMVLHYQPKIDLATGEVSGAEALLRWNHPDWGLVYPERFIEVAEDSGLIVSIGNWVLKEACTEAKKWESMGHGKICLAVNISASEFRQTNFLTELRSILLESELDPSCLQLEITESVLMHDAERSAAILNELKTLGIQLAVDDFGTGYSSLSYLEQFPIDVLKIDQSFLRDLASNPDNKIIVSAIIGMGNNLKLKVIAEGIENQTQLSFLREQDCGEGQGYFFSRPLGAAQFQMLLKDGNCHIDQALQ